MRGAVDDKAELIKWWDAIDIICGCNGAFQDLAKGLHMARECTHEDARWLCALFPADESVLSGEVMRQVLSALGDDRRTHFFFGPLGSYFESLWRSAQLGYAPAQAQLAPQCNGQGPL